MAAFSFCVAAELGKLKEEDMELDGSLCFLPRSSAFGLGITAIICLSVAQVAGTSAAGAQLSSVDDPHNQSRIAACCLLACSWLSFGIAATMLATASSMNGGQAYGKGWMDGDCYVVKNGVYAGSAALVVVTALLILGFLFTTRPRPMTNSPQIQH